MTLNELLTMCDAAESRGSDVIAMKMARRVRADATHTQIIHGVKGEIVQWGDGTWGFPTVAMVEVADVRRVIERIAARNGVPTATVRTLFPPPAATGETTEENRDDHADGRTR